MTRIEKLEDLVAVILEGGEIVAYGMGDVSNKILTWLSYKEFIGNINCIAVKSLEDNPVEFKTLQVYSINELQIFYSTAKFIVLTAENKHDSISKKLEILGCKNIYCLSDFACLQIRYELLQIENDVSFQFALQNELARRNKEYINSQIAEALEICQKNSDAFADYRNKFRDKDIVILATGPSMNKYRYKENAIHIGLNFAYRRADVPLDFLFIQDGTKVKMDRYLQDEIINASHGVKEKVFVGKYPANYSCKSIEMTEEIFKRIHNAKRYFTAVFDPRSDIKYEIYQDICYHPLMDYMSVAFPAIHFALFTNPSRIYLVGCDVTNKGYFEKKEGSNVLQTGVVKMGYLKLKKFVSIYYPNTEIISINPVGLKELFRDVYTNN